MKPISLDIVIDKNKYVFKVLKLLINFKISIISHHKTGPNSFYNTLLAFVIFLEIKIAKKLKFSLKALYFSRIF